MNPIFSKSFLLFAAFLFLSISSCSPKNDNIVVDPSLGLELTAPSQTANDPIEEYLTGRSKVHNLQETTDAPKTTDKNYKTLESLCIASEPLNLFNGIDLEGWRSETGDLRTGWKAESGLLRLTDPANGGDLLTKESFTNFVLTFEWRFGLECNSGIKYKIEQPNGKSWIGLEYQLQDDVHVEDGKIDKRKLASLFDIFPAKNSSKTPEISAPSEKEPSGAFRQGKIVVLGNEVEHWLDDEIVLAFTVGSDEWNVAKSQSKFKNQKNFGTIPSSPILLQNHGYPIDFKSITIRTLSPKSE